MILFLGMPQPVTFAHAVIANTCDVSLTHSESVYCYTPSQSVSNVVGKECSESMREMCGCVSFSVSANAQVYAPQSSWNVQEQKETARQTDPHLSLRFFFSLSLSFPSVEWLFSLLYNPLQAGLLDRNKRVMCLFLWLWTSRGKALAKKQWRTMEMAWSFYRAGLMSQPPV